MVPHPVTGVVRIDLLGRFPVVIGERATQPGGWPMRRAAELVQLLALSDNHRRPREQVVDALWPHLGPEAGAANLRKAAHHARQALGDPEAVVLRGGQVALFPGQVVRTDVEGFESAAKEALRRSDPHTCAEVARSYTGDLLPEAVYEEWTQARREHLRSRYLELLRSSGAWERLIEVDPADESAHRELMRTALEAGNRHAAIRWYGRLRGTLETELGVRPSGETEALYEECIAGLRPAEHAVVGRQVELAHLHAALLSAAQAELTALVLRGPGGIGKSTLCRKLAAMAGEQGWLALPVRATPDSGPYAPLVQAIELLLSRDRKLLDVLPERARSVLAELTMLTAPAQPLDGPLTRHQVIGAARRLLLAAAATTRVVIVVDDAHLADAPRPRPSWIWPG